MLMLLSSSVPAPSGFIPFLCPSSAGQDLCQLYLLGTLPSCFDPAFNQLLKAAALDDHSTLVGGHISIFFSAWISGYPLWVLKVFACVFRESGSMRSHMAGVPGVFSLII